LYIIIVNNIYYVFEVNKIYIYTYYTYTTQLAVMQKLKNKNLKKKLGLKTNKWYIIINIK